ncbi:MAG TPA: transglutaminase domain-containing protein [Myxococcales bacterium]|nr:transglutaminase domain-containing protein [Myxococcales bacterium]
MFRSLKVPFIALVVVVAFAAYLAGPARFRKVEVKVPAPASARLSGMGVPPHRFGAPGPGGPGRALARRDPPPQSADERYSAVLDDVQEKVRQAKLRRAEDRPPDAEVKAIRGDAEKLQGLEVAAAASFQEMGQRLHDANLPGVLQERNLAAEREFAARADEFGALLRSLASADDRGLAGARDAALDRIGAFFERHLQGGPVQKVDPGRLPFRGATPLARAPIASADELPQSLRPPPAARRTRALTTSAPDPNLSSTEDVQITQPIRDLAASLGNNPAQIFGWVRNNVVWLPTYGSVQGSAVTLASRRGNSFDTSSLLIALLRAAGVPARYVYGTIEVPATRVSNWTGGLTPLAAQQLMGQGGIPSVGMIDGTGNVVAVRLEHVWVEALADFVPSRGAAAEKADTWVPLDASFKQYQLGAPIDIKAAVPVDVEGTARAAASTALVDPVAQSLTGFDQGTLDFFIDKMGEDIELKYGPTPDVALFTGPRTITPAVSQVLPGSLPNRIVARAAVWSELPDSLRHKVAMTLYASSLDRALDSPSASFRISLPALAGRRLGVTYVPATDADAAALASFRSAPGTDMPVYLVQVRPSIRIDDSEVALGPPVTMGTLQEWDAGVTDPTDPAGDIHPYTVTAGDEMVFGIDPQGASQETIHQRFLQRPSDTAAENLFTVSLYYWAQCDLVASSAAVAQNAAVQRLPSIGLFSVPLRVGYFFGFPRTGHYGPRQMDVAHSIFAVVEKGNGDTSGILRSIGMLASVLEGRTFDALFGRVTGTGVSAVQLLREANEQQIPIYLVTRDNFATVAPQLLVGSDIVASISDAVRVGKTVLVPQRAPLHGNWSGLGYIIEDPATGAAAYLINGGTSGGSDDPCNPESPKEPVKVPVIEILIIAIIILLIILLLLSNPELIPAIGAILGGLGRLAPAAASLLLALGIGSTPAMASTPSPTPLPGEGLAPPGDCTPAQYATLVAAVEGSCKSGPACKGTDCATLTAALSRLQACVAARQDIMVTCFRGGDQAHVDELENARRAVENCACRVARFCG